MSEDRGVKRRLINNISNNKENGEINNNKKNEYKLLNNPFHEKQEIQLPGKKILLGHFNRVPSPTPNQKEPIGFLSPKKRHVIPARTNSSKRRILEGPYHMLGRNITNPDSSNYEREECYKEKYLRGRIDDPDKALVCLATMLASLRGRVENDLRRQHVDSGHFRYLSNLYRDCVELNNKIKKAYLNRLYNTTDSIQRGWEGIFGDEIRRISAKVRNY